MLPIVEKPSVEESPSNVAILGRYIITPKIFEILENTAPGKVNIEYALRMSELKDSLDEYLKTLI